MPLTPEILTQISEQMAQAQAKITSAEEVLKDLQASGIDSSAQMTQLAAAKAKLAQLQTFYTLQKARS